MELQSSSKVIFARIKLEWKKERSSNTEESVKKEFLGIYKNSQENTCARVSFLLKLRTLDLQHH